MTKIIAVASEGGHWKQLNQLNSFLAEYDTTYVTTNKKMPSPNNKPLYYLPDANKDKKTALCMLFAKALFIFIRVRPAVVISTGAAPGFSMIFWGSLFRVKTIWIDSIANANELSLSGKLAKRYASVVLSQWEDVAEKEDVMYKGALIK